MIAAIRSFAKSWVAAVLIGLLIISFGIFGISDVFKNKVQGDAVIKAGSRTVTSADFKREFDTFRKRAEQQVGQPITNEIAAQNGLDRRVLEDLATREGFGEMLNRMGLRPSDKLVVAEIRKVGAFFNQVTGAFDEKQYESKLTENGLTPASFETIMRDDISQGHLVSAVVNGLRAPRAYSALTSIFALENRDVAFFTIDPRQVPSPALPTDAQLTQFMTENAAQLTVPEGRIITLVRFSPSLISASLPINEADLQKRYEFRRDTLSKPETRSLVQIPVKDAAAAASVGQRLARGEDPRAVAKSLGVDAIVYADKPMTAIADRKVAEAAFALAKGQVSGPVQGDLGLAVVRVDQVTPGRTVTLAEIRPQLEAELRNDAAAEKVYALTQAYDDAHAAGANLAAAAQKAGVPAVTLGPISAQGRDATGQPVPFVTPKIMTTAFELPAGGESEVVEAGQGEYFAVRVEKIIPSALPPLASVKPQLTRVWMVREMAKTLQTKADALAARVRKGESLEAVAASVGSQVGHAIGLDRATAGQSKALSQDGLAKAFSAKSGEIFTAQGDSLSMIVGKLEAVRTPQGPNLARVTEDARPQLTMTLFREIGDSARAASREAVKVKTNPALARQALGLEPLEPAKGEAGEAGSGKKK